MNKLKEMLGEELYKNVSERLGEQLDKLVFVHEGNWIPKEKFNDVNNTVKELKSQLKDRDKQLEELGVKVTDINTLQQEIESLKQINLKSKQDFEAKIKEQQFNFALDNALNTIKAKNPKIIKSLLDIENIKLSENGSIEGLTEQIEAIKKTDSYLFQTTEPLKGAGPNLNGASSYGSSNPFSKENFNLTEQGKLFRENPTLAKTLMEQANAK